ncbi:MAG: Mur ligase family protein [Candidatus Omnitrophota bacterium]|jgi:UDP-N-acetylmuramoylalanine--D-glutamate ligase
MINQDYFKNKKITVIGLGRSGFACARLLDHLNTQVSVSEKNKNPQILAYAKQLSPSINQELGRHTLPFIKGRDLIVVSPGVDQDSQPLVWARELAIPIISEIECAWILCPGRIVAITGTNGKTTTTTLVGKVLERAGKKTFILGNIGTPFSAYVSKIQPDDFVSLEVSSFQLETICRFKPYISVILNFAPDHLDRYSDLSKYLAAKSRIFMNQDESDYLILNRHDRLVSDFADKAKAKVIYFDSSMHSNLNFAAVRAIASVLRIDMNLCQDVLGSFVGLPHRLERIAEFQGREFINDSKATNPDATAFALSNIERPVILIAGGKDKGLDFSLFKDVICHKAKALIALGEAKNKIRQIFKMELPVTQVSDLVEAVKSAFRQSQTGDCILFSPMCSSFDMFRDYEHRGEVFKAAVKNLIGRTDPRAQGKEIDIS